ncbi:pectinesterase family protein [Flavobacterium azooxidireducens]|uniref:Pectinesterase family protein n=1 Tax=Flavobacterium azooxidireducens TaxID=1871076 RepID=A0ABY4KDG6_9FLAO|nr:pectinesterase family protein [Flavobacterium azooxidireducens]UPQ78834.1 pectinesterase family protein [Flavobacterium azooxidireducens]
MKKNLLFCLMFFTSMNYAQNTDVWDFGAVQLNESEYNNQLNESVINAWYVGVTPGTAGVNFPTAFSAGSLSWVGNASDRLRTTNTNLSRFDANVASVAAYSGRVYCNGTVTTTNGLPNNRYLRITVVEDDEITIIARGDTDGVLTFVNEANPSLQTNTFPITSASGNVTEVKFVAQTAGAYRIYDQLAKASFYRIYRKDAVYTNVNGTIDLTQAAGIPNDYSIVFTNEAGKTWSAEINSNTYNVSVPVGYQYAINLVDANGYIISAGDTFNTTGVTTPNVSHNIAISGITLFTVTGNIIGLGTEISNLELNFTPDSSSESVFIPIANVNSNNGTYSVQLESSIPYTILAQGVNDFEIETNTITITENTSSDITFIPKPVFPISIETIGLTIAQESDLELTFTNLNEEGYNYTFTDLTSISLRNGTYKITANGLDNYPLQLALTSNLTVNNASASKTLSFVPVTVWSFDDKVINSTTSTYYKGMQLNGQITTVVASGHLTAKTGSSLVIPVNPNERVLVYYYYTANFSIEGGEVITTSTNSTSIVENVQYVYSGTNPGTVTINVGGAASLTSYFTEIRVIPTISYSETITVGVDKDYQTINAALEAVSYMNRTSEERVTIMIDAGNYEEMLVINLPNITLKNADSNANTSILNGGIDIAPGAVRVTSYYGHGYHYYSMNNKQKWNQDVLNVSLQNGFYTNPNAGAGTTNGSYWNATVVVSANGFEAENIIFENSFNQYISQKEAQDVLVAWPTGSPGARPTNVGNTAVQNRILVERAAAIAFVNNTDKAILNKCRVIGRQDSFFGGAGARVVVYKGDVMGAVDYIFGGMDAVFYKTNLVMNTSDASNDVAYITAAQQTSGRGYLMYECTITSTEPGVETASVYRSKPGYFGRPWQATTSEVVFYNTTIETSNYPGFIDNSLILPLGWQNTLGGTSSGMYEFGTIELSGVNNGPSRASWSTQLANPILNDGTPITTFNFTKGNDNWDPLPNLIANDPLSISDVRQDSIDIFSVKNTIYIKNVKENTNVTIFNISGAKVKSFNITNETDFVMNPGLWIVTVRNSEGRKSVKLITN